LNFIYDTKRPNTNKTSIFVKYDCKHGHYWSTQMVLNILSMIMTHIRLINWFLTGIFCVIFYLMGDFSIFFKGETTRWVYCGLMGLDFYGWALKFCTFIFNFKIFISVLFLFWHKCQIIIFLVWVKQTSLLNQNCFISK
jgi:uncharacterized membrane protein